MDHATSLTDKAVEKTFAGVAGPAFKARVTPTMRCAKRCGNMYTASLYGGLASLIASVLHDRFDGRAENFSSWFPCSS